MPDLNIWQRFLLIKNYTLLNPEWSMPKLTINFLFQFQSHWSLNINLHPRGTKVHGLGHWSRSSLWFFSRSEQPLGLGREVKKVSVVLSCQPWQWKPHGVACGGKPVWGKLQNFCVQHKIVALLQLTTLNFQRSDADALCKFSTSMLNCNTCKPGRNLFQGNPWLLPHFHKTSSFLLPQFSFKPLLSHFAWAAQIQPFLSTNTNSISLIYFYLGNFDNSLISLFS